MRQNQNEAPSAPTTLQEATFKFYPHNLYESLCWASSLDNYPLMDALAGHPVRVRSSDLVSIVRYQTRLLKRTRYAVEFKGRFRNVFRAKELPEGAPLTVEPNHDTIHRLRREFAFYLLAGGACTWFYAGLALLALLNYEMGTALGVIGKAIAVAFALGFPVFEHRFLSTLFDRTDMRRGIRGEAWVHGIVVGPGFLFILHNFI